VDKKKLLATGIGSVLSDPRNFSQKGLISPGAGEPVRINPWVNRAPGDTLEVSFQLSAFSGQLYELK
jgi:hypothetical protein